MPSKKIDFQKVCAVDAGRYQLWFSEINAINDHCRGNLYDTMITSFQYGFIKGQRAAKAEAKRKAGAAK